MEGLARDGDRVIQAKGTLAERIMSEADMVRMLALMPFDRNHALLTLTYSGGFRIRRCS